MLRAVVVPAFAAILLPASPASACIARGAVLAGIPNDGDGNVPTDVVPVYETLPTATLVLETDSGVPVAFTTRATYASHFELVPAAPLAPRTTHFLRATLMVSPDIAPTELMLSFTTGDGPLAARPAAPHVRFQHYSGPAFATLCGHQATGSCLSFGVGSVLDLVDVDSSGVEQEPHYLLRWASFWSLPGDDGQGVPGCMLLRTRSDNAALSEPVTVCGDQAESYELADSSLLSCDADGLTLDGVALGGAASSSGGSNGLGGAGGAGDDAPPRDPGERSSHRVFTKGCGCALPGHASSTGGAWWLVLALTALARRRPAWAWFSWGRS